MIKAVLESDIKNTGVVILSIFVGIIAYWKGFTTQAKEDELPKTELQKLLAQLQEDENVDTLTLQKLQLVHEAIQSLEDHQEELATAITVALELFRSVQSKIESIHTSVEILKEFERRN